MNRAVVVLVAVALVLTLVTSFLAAIRHEQPAPKLGHARIADSVPPVNAWAAQPTTTKVEIHAASTTKARRILLNTAGEIRGFPCGGDLPPCWVLRRESMMAVDPVRVWNGNCYLPFAATGQCGASTASGLWQFLRSTWNGFGGYLNAADAPVHVQNEKARLTWAQGAGCSHWAAC